MKKKIGELCGWIIICFVLIALGLVVTKPSTAAIEPGFIVQGVTAGPTDSSVFVAALVPRDLVQACTSSETQVEDCKLHQDLVTANSPAIDAILIAHRMVVSKNGVVIFNYSHPNPRQ